MNKNLSTKSGRIFALKAVTSPQQVVVGLMKFGKRHDTSDTTDLCSRQLVTDWLQGNWCNGFWPLPLIMCHTDTDGFPCYGQCLDG